MDKSLFGYKFVTMEIKHTNENKVCFQSECSNRPLNLGLLFMFGQLLNLLHQPWPRLCQVVCSIDVVVTSCLMMHLQMQSMFVSN
jgi:hypothetical protein